MPGDFDLTPMTLVLTFDLDIVNIHHLTKIEVSMSTHSKVVAQTQRQTNRHTDKPTDRQIDTMKTLTTCLCEK